MLRSPCSNPAAPEQTQAIVEMQSLSASGEQKRSTASSGDKCVIGN